MKSLKSKKVNLNFAEKNLKKINFLIIFFFFFSWTKWSVVSVAEAKAEKAEGIPRAAAP